MSWGRAPVLLKTHGVRVKPVEAESPANGMGECEYWARTRNKASYDPIPCTLGYLSPRPRGSLERELPAQVKPSSHRGSKSRRSPIVLRCLLKTFPLDSFNVHRPFTMAEDTR
ncbi:hypothetical protein TNCV_112671 [Trichonephila clavipes]|nr:hypothetical protein TNCV_112671 [Trichonephila clavipes]